MGFWSGLGKVGLMAAAPFTGGATLAAIPAVDAIGRIGQAAAGAAQGSREARMANDLAQTQLHNAQIQGLLGRGQLELAQKKFAMEMPMMQAAAAARGDLMQNVQDFSMGGPAGDDVQGSARANAWKSTGGLRPSALGADAKEAARLMVAQQLEGLRNPTTFDKIEFPDLPKASKGGFWENLLGGIGLGGSLVGAVTGTVPGINDKPSVLPGRRPSIGTVTTPPFVPDAGVPMNRRNPFSGITF